VPFDLGHKQFLTTHVTSSELLSLDYSKSHLLMVLPEKVTYSMLSVSLSKTATFVQISAALW